jgi:hypothetical protein
MVAVPAILASDILRQEIKDFFEEAIIWVDGGRNDTAATPRPVRVIKGSAGLGKSRALLDRAKALLDAEPDRRVMTCTPTLNLADELCEDAIARGIQNARVLRGRQQPLPGGTDAEGPWMCAKQALAKQVALRQMSVSQTLCFTPAQDGKPEEECEHRATCPYLAQFQNLGGGLLITAHQWLSLPSAVDALKQESIDILFVDESFWQTLSRISHVNIGQFLAHRTPGANFLGYKRGEDKQTHDAREQKAVDDFSDLLNVMRNVLHLAQTEHRQPTLDDFRAQNLTPTLCEWAAKVEYSRLRQPEITAGMDADEVAEKLAQTKTEDAYSFAGVWMTLARELTATQTVTTDPWGNETVTFGRSTLRGLERRERFYNVKTEQEEDTLMVYSRRKVGFEAIPTCIIDADADTTILDTILAVTKATAINAEWSGAVHVKQVVDRAVSKSMLAGKSSDAAELARNANRRADLWWMTMDMAARHGMPLAFPEREDVDVDARRRRPVLIVFKAVEDTWIAEGRLDPAGAAETPLRNTLPFEVAHLGAIRGIDRWKHACGIIVAGRLEPSVRELEAQARAMFFDLPDEMQMIAPDERGEVRYPLAERCIRLRDGTEQPLMVSVHPDHRVQAVLEQVRECEILQALARIRPIHRTGAACEVIVCTNVPLAGLVVDELVEFDDLVPCRLRRCALRGVLPDLAAGVAAAHPDMFSTPGAVRTARGRAASANGNPSDTGTDKDSCVINRTVWPIISQNEMRGQHRTHFSNSSSGCGTETCIADGIPMVTVHYRRSTELWGRGQSGLVRVCPGETEAQVIQRLVEFVRDAFDVSLVAPGPKPRRKPAQAAPKLHLVAAEAPQDAIAPEADAQTTEPPTPPLPAPDGFQQAEPGLPTAANDDEAAEPAPKSTVRRPKPPTTRDEVDRIVELTLHWLADSLETDVVGPVREVANPEPPTGVPEWERMALLRASLVVIKGGGEGEGKTEAKAPPGA